MTTVENCGKRKKEDYPDAIWLENPLNYLYLRESNYTCCSPQFIPVKKREKCFFKNKKIEKYCDMKLIGYEKPKKNRGKIYCGKYWWLKGYDVGMKDENLGYGSKGIWKDGWKKGIIIIPTEGVKFKK